MLQSSPVCLGHVEQMLQMTVSLTSGRSTSRSVPRFSKTGDLKTLAQKCGSVFSEACHCTRAQSKWSIRNPPGCRVARWRGEAKLAADQHAFALWCGGGDGVGVVTWGVVTWGKADYGGHSSQVQDLLKNVQQVHASSGAFAAICEAGSVVTWGKPDKGGEWRWQLHSPRSAEECAAGSGHRWSICCHLGKWLCCLVGQTRLWRRQLAGPRLADEFLVEAVWFVFDIWLETFDAGASWSERLCGSMSENPGIIRLAGHFYSSSLTVKKKCLSKYGYFHPIGENNIMRKFGLIQDYVKKGYLTIEPLFRLFITIFLNSWWGVMVFQDLNDAIVACLFLEDVKAAFLGQYDSRHQTNWALLNVAHSQV